MSNGIRELRLYQGDVHSNRAALNLVRQGMDIGILSETNRLFPYTRRAASGFRVHTSMPVRKRRYPGAAVDVSTDTTILVKKRFEYLGELSQQVSRHWFNVAAASLHGVPTAIVSLHPNAATSGDFREAMLWMESVVDMFKKMGYAVLLGGNLGVLEHENAPWNPWARMEALGLDVWVQGVSGVAWSRDFRLVQESVIPKAFAHSNHDALLAKFQVITKGT